MDQRAAQGELFLHAARQVSGRPVAVRPQAGEVQQLRLALQFCPCGHPVQFREEVQVFLHRQASVETEGLRHVTDAGGDRGGLPHGV
jgi:hypothetical protein